MNGTPFSAHALRVSVLWAVGCGVRWGVGPVFGHQRHLENEVTNKMDNVTVTVW